MGVNARGIQGRLLEIIAAINETLEELKYHLADIEEELEEDEVVPDKWRLPERFDSVKD